MNAKDRAKANSQNHEKFNKGTEEGAIAELNPVPKGLLDAMKKHELLMNDLQFQGTPGLIYKDAEAHWKGVAGMPSLAQLAKVMGISN